MGGGVRGVRGGSKGIGGAHVRGSGAVGGGGRMGRGGRKGRGGRRGRGGRKGSGGVRGRVGRPYRQGWGTCKPWAGVDHVNVMGCSFIRHGHTCQYFPHLPVRTYWEKITKTNQNRKAHRKKPRSPASTFPMYPCARRGSERRYRAQYTARAQHGHLEGDGGGGRRMGDGGWGLGREGGRA